VISRMFRQDPTAPSVAAVYVQLVAQSRQPGFYLYCGVPDTVDGRFDMLALHAFLVMDRLAGQGDEAGAFAQALFDHLFADMDVNLREMGVGDLSVGKKVKQMAEAFYGRAQAYRDGLQSADPAVLAAALRRNLFRAASPSRSQVDEMAAYARRQYAAIAAAPVDDLLAGRVGFGPVPASGLAEG